MSVLKFKQFNESKDPDYLLYYAFDWDDNILNMPTVIHMEQLINGEWIPVDVSTAKFAEVRNDKENYRILNNNPDDAFSEFRDFGPRGDNAFLMDIKNAIKNGRYGPAWHDFIECLTHGSIFSIITARGHEAPAMRKGVEWIIDNLLSSEQLDRMYNHLLKYAYLFKEEGQYDRMLKGIPSKNPLIGLYLDNCDFIGVSSPSRGGSPSNPEKAKEEALMGFKDKINKFAASLGIKAKIGFSDDDVKNVKHIEDLVDNLSHERFSHIVEFIVKGTKNPYDITKKIRTVVKESQSPGLESSVLPFTQFGNMTGTLYPTDKNTRQDDYHNQTLRQIKQTSKMSKDIFSKKKKRKKRNG